MGYAGNEKRGTAEVITSKIISRVSPAPHCTPVPSGAPQAQTTTTAAARTSDALPLPKRTSDDHETRTSVKSSCCTPDSHRRRRQDQFTYRSHEFAMHSRSELYEERPDAFPSRTTISSTPSISPLTPSTPSHHPLPSNNPGLLTPSSSKASLSPALSHYKDNDHPRPPPFFLDDRRKLKPLPPPNRHLFFPVRASLELHTHPARPSIVYMSDKASRPSSPVRRSRAMSPQRPEHITRPSSRCESLLRDTLRRADEQERSLAQRNASRSPTRWAARRSRPRGNSFLEALRRDDCSDSDCEVDENVFIPPVKDRDAFGRQGRTQAMTMRGRGAASSSSTDAGSLPYGSPASPSPMPPAMIRTQTAPNIPRAKRRTLDDEKRGVVMHRPKSPRTERRSLPNTVSQSHASIAASSEASPKQRHNTLSPHESVLRAKLEYVLQKAGSHHLDESATPSQLAARASRNHQRAFSHGVTVVTGPRQRDDRSSASTSPQSLAPSSLSNSATDLARVNLITSHRRNSYASRNSPSPSSPPELLTPPPTPPFNARTACEAAKRIDGYVSFANVEGLGEPPGLDIDGEDNDDVLRRLGWWWRKLPSLVHGVSNSSEQGTGQPTGNKQRHGFTASP